MFYYTTHVKGAFVYLASMNPACKSIVVSYGSHVFIMCMKSTKYPRVAALPSHVFSHVINKLSLFVLIVP